MRQSVITHAGRARSFVMLSGVFVNHLGMDVVNSSYGLSLIVFAWPSAA